MANSNLKSIDIVLTERDARFILYALSELMTKLQGELDKDPDCEEEFTPMYADDDLKNLDI